MSCCEIANHSYDMAYKIGQSQHQLLAKLAHHVRLTTVDTDIVLLSRPNIALRQCLSNLAGSQDGFLAREYALAILQCVHTLEGAQHTHLACCTVKPPMGFQPPATDPS